MFGRDKDKEQPDVGKIQNAVNEARAAGVRNLSVRQNGTRFEIHGEADTLAAKQQAFKTITDRVGDASGVVNLIQVAQETSAPLGRGGPQIATTPSTGTPAGTAQSRTHTVQKGETLSHIAQRYYGKASQYNKIFEANRDQLKDPDKIREGMTLRIP